MAAALERSFLLGGAERSSEIDRESREDQVASERTLADVREYREGHIGKANDYKRGGLQGCGESEEWVPPTRPPSRPGPQTGPKGVLADYRHHRKQERLRAEAERLRSVTELAKRAGGLSLSDQLTFTQKEERVTSTREPVAGDEEDNEEDDDFQRDYRRRRLQQLTRNRPVFGAVREVREADYVDAIDKEPSSVPVVVHIYANHLAPCRRVDRCLTALAAKYQHAKFLRIDAGPLQFDEVGLPVLLTYRAGKVVSNRTRLSDDLPRIDVESLEALLLKDESLSEADIADHLAAYASQCTPPLFEDDAEI